MKIEAILNLESYFHKVTARWLVKLNYVHACSSSVLCILTEIWIGIIASVDIVSSIWHFDLFTSGTKSIIICYINLYYFKK